jgi:RNA 2',3'-cyclic 3'-phosphodiesterase
MPDRASASRGSLGASPGAGSARLFVALDLPPAVVEALVAWRAPLLRGASALRAVAPEALHVTLCFLGTKPESAIAPLAALVEGCAAGTGRVAGLAFAAPLWLPPRRPRVLALGLEDRDGQLGAMRARLVERLAAGGWHEPESRPYLAHVSVARVRGRDGVSRGVELPPPPPLAFDGAAVVLYRSRPHPSGARYEPLSVCRLV